MRFRKIYLEISNLCNLKCEFCPGTKRPSKRMTVDEFSAVLPKLRPYTDFLYFHLMGEPLSHPDLAQFLDIAGEHGFKVILTTNGTLLKRTQDILLNAPALHKVNVSLHSFEANDITIPFTQYLDECFQFGKAAENKKIVIYRLWNVGGADERNNEIFERMKLHFPEPWAYDRRGKRIGEKIYWEFGEKFDWPDLTAPVLDPNISCYGLRDQLGILCDGTVVPCCLDHEGDIPLGNIFTQSLDEILTSPRATAIGDGFLNNQAVDPLCQRCGYAQRFRVATETAKG